MTRALTLKQLALQHMLDEDSELADNIIHKVSQLKVLKEEAEKQVEKLKLIKA